MPAEEHQTMALPQDLDAADERYEAMASAAEREYYAEKREARERDAAQGAEEAAAKVRARLAAARGVSTAPGSRPPVAAATSNGVEHAPGCSFAEYGGDPASHCTCGVFARVAAPDPSGPPPPPIIDTLAAYLVGVDVALPHTSDHERLARLIAAGIARMVSGPPLVRRGDVLLTMHHELTQMIGEWHSARQFAERVTAAAQSPAAWLPLREELMK